MVGTIKAAKSLKAGQRCVVLLADSVRNYMSKFLNDDWMKNNHFTDAQTEKEETDRISQWGGARIKDLNLPEALTVPEDTICKDAIALMESNGFDQLPVTAKGSTKLVGLVTLGNVLAQVAR